MFCNIMDIKLHLKVNVENKMVKIKLYLKIKLKLLKFVKVGF